MIRGTLRLGGVLSLDRRVEAMKKSVRLLAAAGCVTLVMAGASAAHADPGDSASGQGTLDDGARRFSFSARTAADGTVTGQAQLVNSNFGGTDDSPAPYRLHIEISCMNRVGDTVVFGGTVKNTNDPSLDDAVFFSVQDMASRVQATI